MSKVSFGLKNVHYATFTYNAGQGYTYDAPKPIPGAVELTLENNSSESPFYADNTVYYNTYSAGTYTGTLTIAKLPDTFATQILGEKLVAGANLLVEDNNYQHKEFALLFQIENDEKNDKFCLFRCSASRPGLTGATTTDTVEPQTVELSFTAIAREGDEKIKIRTTDTTPQGVHDSWFTRVLDGSIINSIAQANFTFTKDAAADLTIPVASTGTIVVNGIMLNGATVAAGTQNANWQVQPAGTMVVKQAYLNGLANGVHDLTITTDKGNYITVPLTVQATAP